MPIIPAGYAQATLWFTSSMFDGEAAITWGMRLDVLSAPTALAEAIAESLGPIIQVPLSGAVTIDRLDVKYGPGDTGPSGTASIGLAGDIGGQATTANTAVLCSKQTLLGGRKGRGRMFVPGIPESITDGDGNLSSGAVASWDAAWSSVLGLLDGLEVPMVLLHGDATTPTVVEAIVTSARPATQRRRMRR